MGSSKNRASAFTSLPLLSSGPSAKRVLSIKEFLLRKEHRKVARAYFVRFQGSLSSHFVYLSVGGARPSRGNARKSSTVTPKTCQHALLLLNQVCSSIMIQKIFRYRRALMSCSTIIFTGSAQSLVQPAHAFRKIDFPKDSLVNIFRGVMAKAEALVLDISTTPAKVVTLAGINLPDTR
jgi:hypothetical protein